MRSLALVGVLLASPALATGIEIELGGGVTGTVAIELFEDVAPNHVERIAALAESGAYDDVVFHRVIDGFMAQTGDVQFGKMGGDMARAGYGGSDLPDLEQEFSDRPFERGVVGMARSGNSVDSANSQFFIMFQPAPHLNGDYTVVGEVTSGMEAIDQIPVTGQGDTVVMQDVTVIE
ncbi:peptidylprolyl isomerase [Maribius pontilimi]|uniref:Peptidyl-prolyl cis-trans isomerase n=1 Tax=Palleronia pontilimi TaxID=1964209 RepID=A0A934MDG6_9RHOB|nr:peptidylprolyl isomerase [Palleronia pontilimi]MBJ3763470.1 peptidylprolyl isomerase [Palleronia pontilimi]